MNETDLLQIDFERENLCLTTGHSYSKEIRTAMDHISHFWIYSTANSFDVSLGSNLNIDKNRPTSRVSGFAEICAPTGIRTPVVALKGLRPSPLDDGGKL